jgi:hypothetical protein
MTEMAGHGESTMAFVFGLVLTFSPRVRTYPFQMISRFLRANPSGRFTSETA